MNESLPGKGLFGWLGRQVGHITKAVRTEPSTDQVAFRKKKIEEAQHPEEPGVKLRRTTIDEVIVPKQLPPKTTDSGRANKS